MRTSRQRSSNSAVDRSGGEFQRSSQRTGHDDRATPSDAPLEFAKVLDAIVILDRVRCLLHMSHINRWTGHGRPLFCRRRCLILPAS
jgi:hypothetical protein